MKRQFENEFLGNFISNDKLYRLAEEYYDRCEKFDKLICTGKRKGEAMPMNSIEYCMINKYALETRKLMLQKAKSLGFSEEDFKRALRLITSK